jgi:HD-GYP domain-containing protein (c-di-GMP phosphodiesterase class II)/class 3 adenylate cyclase
MFDKLKAYVTKNFEQVFVIAILLAVLLTGFLLPWKLSILHFFYLPVMVAGFAMGSKKAIQGAILAILIMIAIFLFQFKEFTIEGHATGEAILSLVAWAGFLLLSGYVVGVMHDRSEAEKRKATQLNVELKKMFQEGQKAYLDKKQFDKELDHSRKKIQELDVVLRGMREKMLENLMSTMDPVVAKMLYEKKLKAERREVSVMSASLAGFDQYAAKKQPKNVTQTLNQYLNQIELLMTDFHGHVEGYSGGAILCEFGAPLEFETHALLSVVAAHTIHEKLKRLHSPWELKVGISTGTAVISLIGKSRRNYTAVGPLVDDAMQMRMLSRPGRTLIDAETYNRVKHCMDARLVQAKGGALMPDVTAQIEDIERTLAGEPENVDALSCLGTLYLKKLQDPTRALELFERALEVDPDNTDVKLNYAEANMAKESRARLSSTAGSDAPVYEITGPKNPLLDENRLPRKFYERYADVENLIDIPDELILPIEAMDGSVGHSRVVAVLSYAIAETLGLSETQKKDVLVAGFIQDIGKKLVPYEVLSRSRRLTEEEFAQVRKHPTEAARVLSSAGFNKMSVLEIVEHHHERYNGKGYPHGKSGKQIPVGARVTAVADSYDAMVAWRPYRKPFEKNHALEEIKREARTGFYDPAVVKALLTIVDEQ